MGRDNIWPSTLHSEADLTEKILPVDPQFFSCPQERCEQKNCMTYIVGVGEVHMKLFF